MSISLPSNKREKQARLVMLVKQGSLTYIQAFCAYQEYCRVFSSANNKVGTKKMNIKNYKKQYEYECICGHIWIDSENQGCPMCSEQTQITAEKYESLPPESFDRRY